ncbi:hypothetical protein [Laspinema olomoucense]|uniref:hypothetical protein n=1 Tax=Laspinema olomoucense TaxID=3231600 RepID=UPI0021BA7CA5|nr:hypothetical protein [Laspinema sp. D3d]MCT7975684.1 hypothetical protein [Laspinema sp. D3d]
MSFSLNLFKSRFLLQLVALKVFGTLFAVFIYSRFTSLGDSERYLSAELDFSVKALTNRTHLTELFFALQTQIFPDIIASLIPSVILGYVIYYVFFMQYKYLEKKIFWTCILLPHFVVWSSAAGKEVIAITAFMLVVKSCVDIALYNRPKPAQTLIGLLVGLLMRPHYFIPYFFLLISTYLSHNIKMGKFAKLSLGLWLVSLGGFLGLCAVVLTGTYKYWIDFLDYVMYMSKAYFLAFDAGSNRWDISWSALPDFFKNLWWGMPASIIGPTIAESLKRPIFLPILMEGLLSFYLIFYLLLRLLKLSKKEAQYRAIIIFCFVPALILAFTIHYPFGLFNPGSAVRYKQSLTPLFYFYPLLLIAESKRKKNFQVFNNNLIRPPGYRDQFPCS